MFRLEIETDNAAFHPEPGPELYELISNVALDVRDGRTGGRVMDANGNTVGNWMLAFVPNPEDKDEDV